MEPRPISSFGDPSSSSTSASPDAVVVNSRLVLVDSDGIDTSPRIGVMAGAVVEHSDLRGQWYIGEGAMVGGVHHTGIGSTFPNVKYHRMCHRLCAYRKILFLTLNSRR